MKKLLMIGVASGIAAAAWLLSDVPGSPGAPDATSSPRAAQPAAMPGAGTEADGDGPRLSIDGNVVTESFDDGTEMVLGIRVRKDRKCRVELRDYVTTDGEMFSAYSCTPFEPRAEHPYTHYTDEALQVLAYADAEAAALLGRRLAGRDSAKSYELLVRATALDGDPRHLAWLADVSFGLYEVDGELQVDNVMRQYELAALSTYFGEDPESSLFLRDELLRAGVGNERIHELDDRVRELLQTVRDIQFTVYGELRHGGNGDA